MLSYVKQVKLCHPNYLLGKWGFRVTFWDGGLLAFGLGHKTQVTLPAAEKCHTGNIFCRFFFPIPSLPPTISLFPLSSSIFVVNNGSLLLFAVRRKGIVALSLTPCFVGAFSAVCSAFSSWSVSISRWKNWVRAAEAQWSWSSKITDGQMHFKYF